LFSGRQGQNDGDKAMSDVGSEKAAAAKFRELVDSDEALQEEIGQHVADGSWSPEAIIAIGARHGLVFTSSDLVSMLEDDDELSDFELEMVAAASPISCSSHEV
jgi:hypothetical protein